METVTSADGTRIAFSKSGAGPPLVLVHGIIADHSTTWRYILPLLEPHFTLYAMDRRGRGGSGDATEYSLQREAEDVAAVVEAIGGQVDVFGHSHGGLCSLEATTVTRRIRRLIIYEGVTLGGSGALLERIDRLEATLAAGNVEAALISALRDVVRMPDDEIEMLRAQREAWAIRLRNTPAVPRELRAWEVYEFAPDRFLHPPVPTLLLVGERSPSREMRNASGVAEQLPDARIHVLPGQKHIAMYTEPELLVAAIVDFLTGPGPGG